MKILDCTIRDGGYYTNWDFDDDLVHTYIESLNQLPIDYLEVGYRSKPLKGYLGEYFYCPIYVLEKIRKLSNKKMAVIINEKDTQQKDIKDLLQPCVGIVDMVRIAVAPNNFKRSVLLATAIKELGFEVCFNIMYMSEWEKYPDLMKNLSLLNELADYLYMVDSFGGVFPNDVERIIKVIRKKVSIKLGFHGHNNLELGLINTLTAIENGVEIVDATITGMGRGAGNLRMELLLTVLNSKGALNVNYNALSNVVSRFEVLKDSYKWGTNLPYMVSGVSSLPQKNVMEWVSRRFYSLNSIIRALENQKEKKKDNDKLPIFKPKTTYEKALIIGGGENAKRFAEAAVNFIKAEKNICLIHASSKNAAIFQELDVPQYYCLVGNEGYRLEKAFTEMMSSFKGECILPPFPRKMGTYIPNILYERSYELESITFTDKLTDSHTVLALQTAIALNVKQIWLAGYDGYGQNTITQLERSLASENESLFNDYKNFTSKSLLSILPTEYKELEQKSVFEWL
ncbi:aldolase catalytic domain-containing protein [Flavilitoribacter nigricans]|uniref:aldolase catalytic domain-containing protein n=1 Tax=Flavilitoribacter nigricans TaxID=70997 RepID=UPI001473D359|nr:aldolase catalytic domain-containing protein [Flavilitoribacter nigricans]